MRRRGSRRSRAHASGRRLVVAVLGVVFVLTAVRSSRAGEGDAPFLGKDGEFRLPILRRGSALLQQKFPKGAAGELKSGFLTPADPGRREKARKTWPRSRSQADGGGGEVAENPCTDCPVLSIDCNGVVEGELAATDCQFADGTSIDVWTVEIPGPREVKVRLKSSAFDTFLFLLNDQCETLATNDDCEPGNFDLSCISIALPAGTYFILANSLQPGESGAYVLEVGCAELTTCVDCLAGSIGCSETKSGTLSGDDCVSGAGTFQDIYSFELTEKGRITARLRSESFDTFLELLDGDCIPITFNDDCTPENFGLSCIAQDLDPGTYHLGVTSFGAGETGDYDVSLDCQLGFDLCADCRAGSIACGETVGGTFPATGCLRLDGSSVDLYAFDLEQPGPVTFNLRSAGFDTFLYLYDSSCDEVAFNDDCALADLSLSCLEDVELEAGSYFIGVSSFAPGESGDFTLEVKCRDVSLCRDCTVGDLACGEKVRGNLGAGSCDLAAGRPFDIWRLEVPGPAETDLTFSLTSPDFDPVLAVLDSTCEIVCEGEGADSCLDLRQLVPGVYYVRVSGLDAGAGGAYDLQVDCAPWEPCASCVAETIACGGTVSGELAAGDCSLPDGTFFEVWPFSLDRAQSITVDLTSDDFDAFAYLLDTMCEVAIVANDDCAEGTTNSCLEADLAAGDYFLVANSFAPATGSYRLSLSCGDITTCQDCGVGSVVCGQPVAGSLPTSGCQLPDGSSVDYYELLVFTDGTVDIRLSSTGFDTFLFLFSGDCVPIDSNDDCEPGNFDLSCLSLDLQRGTYYVAVNSLAAGESGDYELTLSCTGGNGGFQVPGDCNGDGRLDLADGICLLNSLFLGHASPFVCGDAEFTDLDLSNFDGENGTTVTDAIGIFNFIFEGGPPHVLGVDCVPVLGCESACRP